MKGKGKGKDKGKKGIKRKKKERKKKKIYIGFTRCGLLLVGLDCGGACSLWWW